MNKFLQGHFVLQELCSLSCLQRPEIERCYWKNAVRTIMFLLFYLSLLNRMFYTGFINGDILLVPISTELYCISTSKMITKLVKGANSQT